MTAHNHVVLVTGMPRSGTTAIGEVLGRAPGAAHLHEPMNGQTGLTRVRRHFEIPGTGGFEEQDLEWIVDGVARLRLDFKRRGYPRNPLWRRLASRLLGSRPRVSYLRARMRPGLRWIIWKDPLALFCIREIRAAGVPVVVSYRSPFALAASMKRMSWGGQYWEVAERLDSVSRWPDQPLPRRPDDPAYSVIENAALLWRAAYEDVLSALEEGERLLVVENDGLISDPRAAFERICAHAGMPWSEALAQVIERTYATARRESASTVPRSGRAHDPRRDLAAANAYWVDVLTEEERSRVAEIAGGLHERLLGVAASAGLLAPASDLRSGA